MPKSVYDVQQPMRDDFRQPIKDQLAKRVGFRCSNPDCRKQTSGPQSQDPGAINIGVAAHKTAAAPGGPRYDSTLTPEERMNVGNGIWLCQTCAKIIGADEEGYPVEILEEWKKIAEKTAFLELRGLMVVKDNRALLERIESEMPDLIAEMRNDLMEHPLHRDFILIGKRWHYSSREAVVLSYYFEDHRDLRQKVRILENHGFVTDITHTNVEKFTMSEELVDYLKVSV